RRRVDALVKAGRLPDHGATTAERLLTQAKAADQSIAARWTLTTGSDAYLSAFCKLLADPQRGHVLWDGAEQKAWRDVAELKAMSLSDPAGGYLVPFTLDPTIMLSSAGSVNPLRQIARVVQTVTDSWNGVSSDGVVAEWLAEGTEAADASPTTAQPSIPTHKGSAFVPYSYEVGMDAVNFGGQLGELLADAADQLQAAAYMNGTGVGQPVGLTTALPAGSQVATAAPDVLAAADLVGLQNALPPRFQPRAQWLASLATINTAGSLETTNGALRFPEIGSGQLLRKPLHEASMLDAAGDTAAAGNDRVAVYGDFTHFVIADRIGTTIELIPNLLGANGRPTGQRGLFLWFRTGSDVVVENAFRMLTA
ncbi:phage major capsid protein, partial [Pseudonocardia sichuanensis]